MQLKVTDNKTDMICF